MFNKDFYPTPVKVVEKMLEGIDWKNNYQPLNVLEPSAGKGDIVDIIYKNFNSVANAKYNRYNNNIKINIDCIEIEPELQAILKEKKYRLVYNDFLSYDTYKKYDLIIMNPPFSNGAKHLLKAINLISRGGYIICLLNAETIKNPYSNDRIELLKKLKEYNADIQYLENVFVNAERKTNVETALIKLHIPEQEKISFIWSDTLKRAEEKQDVSDDTSSYYLADNDFFKVIVNQFNVEVEAGLKLIREYKAMIKNIGTEFNVDGTQSGSIITMSLNSYRNYNGVPNENDFLKDVRYKYWKTLFNNPKFIGQLTSNLKQSFYNKIEELKEYDFNLYNIYQLKQDMSSQVIQGIEETILDLFDDLSHKYSYIGKESENIHLYNGWKTNKAYIINKKVVLPLNMYETSYRWGTGEFNPFRYQGVDRGLNKLKDIEKVFNYLDGGITDALDMETQLNKAVADGQTKNIDLKYFKITFYKKGTAHLTFKNDDLLKKFNIFGSQKKGWLPDDYGKKKYKDMSDEEKSVIDSFEGSDSYNKTMSNTNYFLVDGNSLLMIEG